MFQSIKFIKNLGFHGRKIEALYEITDTNFKEEVVVLIAGSGEICAIVEMYERKHLNVAKNLLLFFKNRGANYKNVNTLIYSFVDELKDFLISNPDFKYKEEVENYLLLV